MMRRVLPEMIEKALHLNQKQVVGGDVWARIEMAKQDLARKKALPAKQRKCAKAA